MLRTIIKMLSLGVLALCAFIGTANAQAPKSNFAEVNGVRMHYLAAGKGDPVILLHGYTQSSHMWLP